MEIKPVADILFENSLGAPTLNALIPNADNYTVFALQPKGDIEASAEGVRSRDQALAARQFDVFLTYAKETQADVVITPEYSMPWEVLKQVLSDCRGPVQGKLWALGCESIKINELESLKAILAPFAKVIYEPLDATSTRFLSPLAYVFVTPPATGDGEAKTVLLIQFKTHAMGDQDHFEINGMLSGTRIYQFGGHGQHLKLVSLICADAFALTDDVAEAIHDRALILHIQLNQNPRNEWFLGCRERLLHYDGDATEVLCLNWSEDVRMYIDGHERCWKNIAGSAWYLKAREFDNRDTTICNNHKKGFYYTWLQPYRSHTLFFNYKPAAFLFVATKVAHIAVAGPVSRRRGPLLTKICNWDDETGSWVEKTTADDGFSGVVTESGNAQGEIKRIADVNPLEAERILALCAGEIKDNEDWNEDWHKVHLLDSCVIESSEIIRRVTFAQDTHEQARRFRIARLKRCSHLWEIIKNEELPPALSDLKSGFRFKWSPNFPQQNIESTSGKRATVIYMGEECSLTHVEATEKHMADYLHKSSSDADQSLAAQQRLHVWYRDQTGTIVPYKHHRYVKIDQTRDRSPFDIGREE
ncbi:MAG: hypothetical protein PHU49_01375 [Syntrophorhabdaceae bacterium]|nr:hypothetical protein [Syntrophorhabdaceae bacterium]MDD5242642.1 hypothetical protein [Syntrophorhabdaceae bacterium]